MKLTLSIATACALALWAAPASADRDDDPMPELPVVNDNSFSGVCQISGTVIPFTDFSGHGTCTGWVNGIFVNGSVTARATATGLTVDALPVLQSGSGSIYFPKKLVSIRFTFQQVGTTLVIQGLGGGVATGEVVPLDTEGATRDAQVVATTVTPLQG